MTLRLNYQNIRQKIALQLEGRTGKECRERYVNELDPLLKRSMWTHDEDAVIKRMHNLLGDKWIKIMEHLPGRSDQAIRNRYLIISRDNYSDHNHHTVVKRAFQMDAVAKANAGSTTVVPESIAVRLERFRIARDLMDRKIEKLLSEPENFPPVCMDGAPIVKRSSQEMLGDEQMQAEDDESYSTSLSNSEDFEDDHDGSPPISISSISRSNISSSENFKSPGVKAPRIL